ncbi:cell division ATP-binding protein FtsE [Dentiradicibacter hellwigii]|jgi:ABC transporter related|uniref:ATP-binding cassette domain-containing protein n=1 Tax=Dentiradicibacter hellwigii TaxID=3149053 RepID=A0ABV4UBT6_9RHOO
MITANVVCKRYPEGIEALRDVSFTIDAGEMVFITGHSGAGKTTLFRLLAAIERPTSGSIVVNGQNISALRRSAIPYLRRNFGLVFQDQKLLFDRSVLNNVLLPLAIIGMTPKEALRRANAALDKVGLLDRANANPVALSGGEQQRLAIARAVVNRPAILLIDEPTANLDSASAAAILDIFRAFHQVGVTLIIATHDPLWMAHFGSRRLHLEHGHLQEYTEERLAEAGEYPHDLPHDPANGLNTNKGAEVNEDHGKKA